MKRIPILCILPLLVSCQSGPVSITDDPVPVKSEDNYGTFYEIFVSSYADSDGDGIGDLKGIEDKIPELSYMNYTGIYLTPIFSSPSYHKYNISDYYQIDDDFGDMDAFQSLLDTAHEYGIKVIIDLVMNHTSASNSWFSKSTSAHNKKIKGETLTQEERNFADLYSFYDTQAQADSSGRRYKKNQFGFFYECNFDDDMPEINFDSSYAKELFKGVMEYYLDLGVDGYRLDATTYYYYNDTNKNIEVLRWINDVCKNKKPSSYIVGECWQGASTIKNYYSSGIDSFFYFPMSTGFSDRNIQNIINNPAGKKRYFTLLENIADTSQGGIEAPFLCNHDMGRVMTTGGAKYNKAYLGLLSLMSGNVFHYYGDDIGMTSNGTKDEDYRTHYRWDSQSSYNCKDPTGTSVINEFVYDTYEVQKEDPESQVNYVRRANLARRAFPVIARGKVIDTDEKDSQINDDRENRILVVRKEYEDERMRFLVNLSSSNTSTYTLNKDDQVRYVLTQSTEEVAVEDGTILLPPYSIAFISEKGE